MSYIDYFDDFIYLYMDKNHKDVPYGQIICIIAGF